MTNSPYLPSDQFWFSAWPSEYKKITQHFGVNPGNYAQFGLPGHEGVDIRAPNGSKIFCVAPGTIVQVNHQASQHNYGIYVRVDHEGGYQTIYAHLQKALVSEGDQVDGGDVLGLADNTGNSFGAHLHLTLKKKGARYKNWPKNIIDPTPFLLPLIGWQKPVGPYLGGWISVLGVVINGDLAQVNPGGVTLRINAQESIHVPEATILLVAGKTKNDFLPVQVSKASVGLEDDSTLPLMPGPQPPSTIVTIDGWAWEEYLHLFDNQAIANVRFGINLRSKPDKNSQNIGVVRASSTLTLLGEIENGYRPVRVRKGDFVSSVQTQSPMTLINVHDDFTNLPDDVYVGWVKSQFVQLDFPYAYIRHQGVYIRNKPQEEAEYIGFVKGGATATIVGKDRGAYTPILVDQDVLLHIQSPKPTVEMPEGLATTETPPMPPAVTIKGTIPGWVLSSEILVQGDTATVKSKQVILRENPRRNANVKGSIPLGQSLMTTGQPLGEFTPVRVNEDILIHDPVQESVGIHPNDPGIFGQARIGLHASADPDIGDAEHAEFAALKPGIIKVLSFHNPDDVGRLAAAHPNASWVVRAFLSFGGRHISPQQFLNDTVRDVQRTLDKLEGKDVVIELHNEPNLTAEGLGSSWTDGRGFSKWWLELLALYRREIPHMKYIYPGLSPGTTVNGIKIDHTRFVEESRAAVEEADGLATHLYWSNVYPMTRALDVLDDYISRFRNKPIWITEASNNKRGTTVAEKSKQYLQFWHELQKRPIVQGVTYFVASASNPEFAHEVWVGRGIGKLVGMR